VKPEIEILRARRRQETGPLQQRGYRRGGGLPETQPLPGIAGMFARDVHQLHEAEVDISTLSEDDLYVIVAFHCVDQRTTKALRRSDR
jgi:hypothetical protein